MLSRLFLIFLLLFQACGIEIDTEGALDLKWFKLHPAEATCSQIDILCRTAISPPYENRTDYDAACIVYIDAAKLDRDELLCIIESKTCAETWQCPIVQNNEVLYQFTHTEPTNVE